MKRNKHLFKLMMAVCLLIASSSFAQQMPSKEVRAKLQLIYNGIKNPEISFERFVEINAHVYANQTNVFNSIIPNAGPGTNALPSDTYCSKVRPYCSNSDFETGLDQTQYTGAYGLWSSGLYPNPFALTYGFISGDLYNSTSHQTIVNKSDGADPIAGIPLVASNGGNRALRLGNAVNGLGTELIAKTIQVDANENVLGFYYSLVLQDPGHAHDDQPAFSVRVYDCATGLELPNVCDLGNGSNIAVADANNPFFQNKIYQSEKLVYRNWSSVQIDLSRYIGKTVIVIFNVKDCNLSGHFGYAYLDNLFSSNCPAPPPPPDPKDSLVQGNVLLPLGRVDSCGTGNICIKYTLPKVISSGNTTVGTVTASMDIYQNSNLVRTITSPAISTYTADSSYCFSINPANLGLNASLAGFDYRITGRFTLSGYSPSPVIIGNTGTGVKSGVNNDYLIACSRPPIVNCPLDDTIIANPVTCMAKVTWNVPTAMFPDTIAVASGVNMAPAYLIYKGTFNGHGYYESTDQYNWANAISSSRAVGAHLISITSAAENNFVMANFNLRFSYTWIGLRNTGTVGSFVWVTGEPLTFTNWIPGEPNNLYMEPNNPTVFEPFVHINGYYDSLARWNDNSGSTIAKYLAEYDSALITYRQISGPTNGDSLKAGTYSICYERTNTFTQIRDTCCFSITVLCSTATPMDAISSQSARINEADGHLFNAIAYPNPTNTSFKVKVVSDNSKDKITMKVVDIAGRVVDVKSNITSGSILNFGNHYAPGVYFTAITQGSKTINIKLVKN